MLHFHRAQSVIVAQKCLEGNDHDRQLIGDLQTLVAFVKEKLQEITVL